MWVSCSLMTDRKIIISIKEKSLIRKVSLQVSTFSDSLLLHFYLHSSIFFRSSYGKAERQHAALLPHRKKVLSSAPPSDPSLCRVCVGSVWVVWFPPTVQRHIVSGIRLSDDSKLPIGFSRCLSLCASPCLLPYNGWDSIQNPYCFHNYFKAKTWRKVLL